MKLNKYLIITIVTLISMLKSQFIEFNIELDLRRLSESDRQLFETFVEDVENYFLNTQFGIGIDDLSVAVDCKFVLESISKNSSQTVINAQAIFSNKLDQYKYAKSIQFPYEKGKKIYFNSTFEPLASLLDYYAFIFIGTELDTYEYLGGTSYFKKALEISKLGQNSDWSNGWENRWKKIRKLKRNEYLRSMRFNYFLAIDEMSSDEVDALIINNSMKKFYEDFKNLDKKIGSDKNTLQFLKAYHKSIAELFSVLKMYDAINQLALYDHDHKKIYIQYLTN